MPSVPGSGTHPAPLLPLPLFIMFIIIVILPPLLFVYFLCARAKTTLSLFGSYMGVIITGPYALRDVARSALGAPFGHQILSSRAAAKAPMRTPLLLPSRHFQLLRFDTHGPPITAFGDIPCPRQTSSKLYTPLFAAFRHFNKAWNIHLDQTTTIQRAAT